MQTSPVIPRLKIRSMGKSLPANVVSSEHLEKTLALPAGSIYQRSGVSQRHWISTEKPSEMAAKALSEAMQVGGLTFENIDLLICASASFDYFVPFNACLVQRELGHMNSGTACFDIDATCLSFVVAMDVANAFIQSGRYRRIAIVSAEIASMNVRPEDLETYTLFGDGAAAAIVEVADESDHSRVLTAHMETYAAGAEYTILRAWGGAEPPSRCEPYPDSSRYFQMEGRHLLKFTFEHLPQFLERLYQPLDFTLQDTDLIVPHQASLAGINYFKRIYHIRPDQIHETLATNGNCISASIPIALYDAIELGKIQRGQRLSLMGTAAGLSLGGIVMVY